VITQTRPLLNLVEHTTEPAGLVLADAEALTRYATDTAENQTTP
jgi:hypothetical protein